MFGEPHRYPDAQALGVDVDYMLCCVWQNDLITSFPRRTSRNGAIPSLSALAGLGAGRDLSVGGGHKQMQLQEARNVEAKHKKKVL